MFAALDEIELFRDVGIGAVAGAEEFAAIVPGKTPGVADAAGEDGDGRILRPWIYAPNRGGDIGLGAFPVYRGFAGDAAVGLAAVGAGAAGDVEKTIGALGDVADAVVVVIIAPRIGGLKPRFRQGNRAGGGVERGGAVNDDAVEVVGFGGGLAVGDDVETAGGIDGETEGGDLAGCGVGVGFRGEELGRDAG